ncbi:transposase [Corynebacterium sp. LK2510]|uniref:transposase n=1 Tax=Corynebacterium sp. LK2510 TaxID=3110472 RepID=UPI0034CF9FAA
MKFLHVAHCLEEVFDELLAFTQAPNGMWTNNPTERLNRDIRGHANFVGILPNCNAVVCPVGVVLADQHGG